MRLLNFKSLVGVAALGLALLANTVEANAQGWGTLPRHQRQAIRQQQRIENQRITLERRRLLLEQQRLHTIQARNDIACIATAAGTTQTTVESTFCVRL
jgi:hypothetical protein